jgi:ABC-type transport system involved in multi-copper enzyme maturation permease subunit
VNTAAAADFGTQLSQVLVVQHFLILLLATPAYTAGAITDEKSRGTLQHLFTADLTSWEIILGKLFGRVSQAAALSLATLPVLCFIGVFGGTGPLFFLAFLVVSGILLFALTAASLLASVWSRQTRDAVLAVYACGAIGAALLWLVGLLRYFDPLYVLEPAWGGNLDPKQLVLRLSTTFLAWGTVGAVCLALAGARLRPAYQRQLQNEGKARKPRWWLARRPEVSDEPIHWKERQIEGVAPLVILRRLPRWLGLVVIFLGTAAASLLILWVDGGGNPLQLLPQRLRAGLPGLTVIPGRAEEDFLFLSMAAGLAATLVIGVRCSGAITGERERQTWEALLMTPLPTQHFIRGKLHGILAAGYPYLLAYAVPALVFSLLAGPWAVCWTVAGLGVTWLAMRFIGAVGLWCSVRAASSWRSLLSTLGVGYVGGFFLYCVASPVMFILWMIVMITLSIIDSYTGGQWRRAFAGTFESWIIASCVILVVIFLLLTYYLLRSAEQYVADRERIRHRKNEPRGYWPHRRRRQRRPLVREEIPEALPADSDNRA